MRRRWSVLLGLTGAVVAGGVGLGPGDPPAAEAVGLSVLCPGDEPAVATLNPIPTSLVFEGDAITGQHHERTTFPASAIALADPDGTPAITAANMVPLDLDNDGQADLEVAVGLRTSTAAETAGSATGATPLDALLTENYGHRPDSAPGGSGVEVLGLDLLVKLPSGSWIRDVPEGHYAADVGFRFERLDEKGAVVDHLDVVFTIDALQAFARGDARFPDEARMSLVQKYPDPAYDDIVSWAVGQEVVYDGLAADDLPPLDTGATVTRSAPGPEPGPGEGLLDVDLAWDRMPEDFAVGVGQTCPSERDLIPVAHFATNMPNPASAGHDVDVAVRSGIGGGLDGADEVRVEGRITDMPRLVDLLEREGVIDLVRSTGASPTVRLRRLDLAVDDPTTGDDQPIHAHGRLEGLPAHVRVDHERDPATGELTAIDVHACPEIDGSDLLPFFLPTTAGAVQATGHVDGCIAPRSDPAAVKIRDAHLVVQNFLPDGRYGGAPSATLAQAPPPVQQAGRVVRYEQPGGDGPWQLVSEELPAVERTAFVLAAAQHPQYSPGANPNILLVRAGADLADVESLSFRTEAGSRRPAGEPPEPDDRMTFGARDTTTISTRTAAEPLAQVIAQLNRRTDLNDWQLNRGESVYARGTIAPLPGTIDALSFASLGSGTVENVGGSVSLRVAWDLSAATLLDLHTVHVHLPGQAADGSDLPALGIRGEAELSLPAEGAVELAEEDDGGRQRSVVTYEPGTAGDELRLRLAARVATWSDWRAQRSLRIVGDVRVTEPLTVTLDRRSGDRGLIEASVDACASAATCDNDVHVDAVMGPGTAAPTLAAGLTPPAPEPPRPWVLPRPAEANDLAVVVEPPSGEDWGASLDLRDLAHLAYRPGPGDMCVRSGIDGPLTAQVQAPGLWFGGRLSRVPAEARLRIAPEGADRDEPWIWLDTTSCTTAGPPVEATAPQAGPGGDGTTGRPVLDARAIVFTPGAALAQLPSPPAGPPTGDKIAVHAEVAADGSTAVTAHVRERVPDHLLVWRPTMGCGQGGGLAGLFRDIAACASPQWQHTSHQLIGLRVQSTRPDLGALDMSAHVAGATSGGEWRIDGAIPELPGSLHAGVRLDETPSLGWNDVLIDAVASTQIGDVKVVARDLGPDRVGFTGDAAGANRTAVPELSVVLHDAADELHVTARRRTGQDVTRGPVVGERPGEPICGSGHPATRRGEPGVAYLHADVRLDGVAQFGRSSSAEDVVIDVVNGTDDPRGRDAAGQLATISSDQPVDATVRTRLTNIAVFEDPADVPDPIGRGWHLLVVPAILDIFFGDTEFEACLDFDLPLDITLTDTTTAQLANEGSVFAIDADNGPGAGVELQVGELGGPTPRPGIPFAYRSVDFDPSGVGDFSESGAVHLKDTTAVPITPGTSDIADCQGNTLAYEPGTSPATLATLPTGGVSGAVTARDGSTTDMPLTRATFVLDLLWSAAGRGDLAARDRSSHPGCPGTELFKVLARSGTPPVRMPLGRAGFEQVKSAEYTMTQSEARSAGEFCSLTGWDTSAEDRPPATGEPDYPLAIGADGTRYSLHIWSRDPNQTVCKVNLVARDAGGGIRWTRPIAESISPLHARAVEWTVRIFPDQEDGSVEVQLRQRDLSPGSSYTYDAVWAGRLDAGGRGEVLYGSRSTTGNVLSQLVGLERRLNPPDVNLGGSCTGQTMTAPAAAPGDVIRVWYFGDGSAVHDRGTSVDHCYARGGDYYAQYVDYRDGDTVAGGRWEVWVPG